MKKILSNPVLYITLLLLILATGYSFFIKEWEVAYTAIGALILTLLPLFLKRKYKIYISHSFISFVAVFIYATIFLGEVLDFYDKFWWWDLLWHMCSAIGFGLIGGVLLLLISGKHRVEANPALFTMFSFCFAVSVGVLWEIFEFSMDQTFGTNMQKSGLIDTMADIIINVIGAGIASVGGYLYIIKSKYSFFENIIEENYIGNKSIIKHKRVEEEKET